MSIILCLCLAVLIASSQAAPALELYKHAYTRGRKIGTLVRGPAAPRPNGALPLLTTTPL